MCFFKDRNPLWQSYIVILDRRRHSVVNMSDSTLIVLLHNQIHWNHISCRITILNGQRNLHTLLKTYTFKSDIRVYYQLNILCLLSSSSGEMLQLQAQVLILHNDVVHRWWRSSDNHRHLSFLVIIFDVEIFGSLFCQYIFLF